MIKINWLFVQEVCIFTIYKLQVVTYTYFVSYLYTIFGLIVLFLHLI